MRGWLQPQSNKGHGKSTRKRKIQGREVAPKYLPRLRGRKSFWQTYAKDNNAI